MRTIPAVEVSAMDRAQTVTIGEVEIASVWDGTLDAEIGSVRRIEIDEAQRLVDAEKARTGIDPLVLPVRAFLVRTPSRLALVDAGSGTTKGPSMGHLPDSLAAIGVAPETIDCVLMTHLHMDHIGGIVDAAGLPAFVNAELVIHEAEARFFLETPDEQLDARSRRNLVFQRDAVRAYGKRCRKVRDGEGIEGVRARLAPGHTPGHTLWEIASGGARAVVIGDIIHLGAVQLPRPDSAMIYDVDADGAIATRCRMLAEWSETGSVVVGAHLPGDGIGRIARAGDGYRFEPAR
jgi:glyoxylase-like metal-dependent hydrolase (beta-lactamase superfamily II)